MYTVHEYSGKLNDNLIATKTFKFLRCGFDHAYSREVFRFTGKGHHRKVFGKRSTYIYTACIGTRPDSPTCYLFATH